MNYRRVTLNIVYGSFFIWISGYILSQLAPIVFFPIPLVYMMIYPFGAILLAILLLIAGERWLSEERVMAFVLCIPLIITFVAPYVHNQLKLHLMNPDIPMIEAHFNEYLLIEPYPELTLASENNQWYLEHEEGNEKNRIFVMELSISDFSEHLYKK